MRSRLLPLLAIAALLLLGTIAATGRSAIPTDPLVGSTDPQSPDGGAAGNGTPERVEDLPLALNVLLSVVLVLLLALAVLGLVVLIGRVRLGRRRARLPGRQAKEDQPEQVPVPEHELRRACREALDELTTRTGGPPSDAVIAAWLRLERVVAERGTGRQPHQTPTEFTGSVLAEYAPSHPGLGAALDELRRYYHRARFGKPGTVGSAEASAAADALHRVLSETEVPAS